jgi:hypothetical protein
MSTILKTLRKLEEEKNTLNQKLDLKRMLLKEDQTYQKSIKLDRRNFFLLIIMVTGLLILGGIAYYYWSSNSETPRPLKYIPTNQPREQALLLKDPSRLRTFEGVPMAAILNNELALKSVFNKNVPSKRVAKLLSEEVPEISTYNGEEIENSIQSKTALEKNNSAIPPKIQSGTIPGIKVKGIIFFDENSSSNHIIATTKNNSNLKLRVGEAIQGSILKSIHPNHVIFLSNGGLIEVNLGR